MKSHINGIPCEIRVTHYAPYVPATWYEPADGPEVEFEVCDTRGYKAEWLERKLTIEDYERICHECYEYIKHEERNYCE